jgi:uncharacterized protein YdeI (YjbR/CyaY-like superfamily)
MTVDDQLIISCRTQAEWENWLSKNYATSDSVWLRFFKKNSGVPTVVYAEALDEALCYGWIDGIVKKYDDKSYLQRFTPRRKKSIWSKRNTEHVARLIKLGKMKPSGLKEVEAAKADGRWDKAYSSQKDQSMPEDFLRELAKNKNASEFFETLNKSNKYAIAWQLLDAKRPETRERRVKKFIAMLERKERLY